MSALSPLMTLREAIPVSYTHLFSGRKLDFRNATAISIGEQSDLLNIKLVHMAEEQRGGTIRCV